MKHLYEIFERFPDDSSLWRESATGTKRAQRKLMELASRSANPIYALDLISGEVIWLGGVPDRNKNSHGPAGDQMRIKQGLQIH